MNADTLLENFEILAEAPGGINRLRQLIIKLALEGNLLPVSAWHKGCLDDLVTDSVADGDWIESKDQDPNGDVRLIQLADIGAFSFRDRSNRFVNRQTFFKLKCKLLKSGDVLIARLPDPIGRACIFPGLDQDCITVVDVAIVRPDLERLLPKYLLLILNSVEMHTRITNEAAGTTRLRIATGKIRKMSLDFPESIAEQQLIAAKVDELMALCDQLEQQQKYRDNLRVATRKSAIDAISTATTPEELEAAWKRINNNWSTFSDALEDITSLRRLILDLLMSGNLPAKNSQESNWVTKKFDDLGQCRLGKMLDKAKNTGELRPYLRNTNVQWFRIDKSDVANMRVSQNEADEFTLKAGDLLICEGGQPGRCSIVGAAEESLLFQKALHRFRPNDSTDVKFVAYSLLRASMNGTLEKLFTGVTIKHLTGQSLKGLEIAIPSIGEQGRVVAEVDEFMALCDQLESELKSRSEVAEKFARSSIQQYLGN